MANDDRDLIERAESMTNKLYGSPASIGQIADNFALYGLQKRAATLEDIDAVCGARSTSARTACAGVSS